MTGSNMGPYRATALWNEAVILFRDNMPLQEHRHRLHKHRKAFTGHAAVSFLHGALRSNPLFNPDVTREQACQLLKQFLKAELIIPVRSCSISNNKQAFHDSNKYLYEFSEKLLNFKRLTPLSTKFINNSNTSLHLTNDSQKENLLDDNEKSWKLAVIKRIIELLAPCDVNELLYLKEINPKWVATNANPEWDKLKWNTELPDWILSTMQKLLKYSSKDYCKNAYPSFHIDAFRVISDYFKTLETPIILQCFYKLYIEIYNYLDYLNNIDKANHDMKMSCSQEDLIFRILSPMKKYKGKKDILVPNSNLPPNHCYEAEFIYDDPTFRVVPQSSVDSVHLQKGKIPETKIHEKYFNDSNDVLKNNNFEINKKRTKTKPKKTPLKSWDNNNFCNRSKELKAGIVNEGFAIFSPKKCQNQDNNLDFIKYRSYDCLNTRSVSCISEGTFWKEVTSSSSGYVNHGLSFSLEDMNLLENDRLDYNYAMQSLDTLMKVTKYNLSTSDDEYSFHTALSSSETELSDNELSQDSPSSEEFWNPRIIQLGITIFQLLIMLLPPCNRAQLKNLSVLMSEVSQNPSLSELSLQNMIHELSWSILRPKEDEPLFQAPVVNKILSFIVRNHLKIFMELPSDLLSVITNEIYEHQLQAFSYCKQITEKQFEKQKSEESTAALNQLLDHIINNAAISEKERKKHLKVFKESYPAIYKTRFPSETSTSKSKNLFSFKNFRL